MNDKRTGLENFVERHRADFDAFEPRPDLWDDIERELAAPTAGFPAEEAADPAPLRILKLDHEATETIAEPVAAKPWAWLTRPGMAASVALLMLSGIGGAIWSSSRGAAWASLGTASGVVASTETDAELNKDSGLSGASLVAKNSAATAAPEQRLATAVQRMEDYYATQISERQAEVKRLEAQTPETAPASDWQRELTALDSTYRQLKGELYRNPEPEVVLDAMNRNLQIRLDILNQQARTREQMQEYQAQAPTGAEVPKP